jgi:anti-sigma-K factor RskA
MTEDDLMPETHDCGVDAAAYVLGALEPHEAKAFRAHLASCVVCRDEVGAFQQAVDALPMAVPQQPAPRRLRRRVRRAVRAEPKAVAAAPRRGRILIAPRPLAAGLAALAAAVATVGGIALSDGGSGGTRVIQASVVGSTGSAQLRIHGGHAQLVINHFPPPPRGRIYELWIKRGQHAPSPTSALFSVTSRGAGNVGVPGSLRGVTVVMVTPEPAGGSSAPTHAPVIVARLV